MKKVFFVLGLMISIGLNAQWSELGGTNSLNVNSSINAIHCDNVGKIYIGGGFSDTANYSYRGLLEYSSGTWKQIGSMLNLAAVEAIYKNTNGTLFVGGVSQQIGADTINESIYQFNGTDWIPVSLSDTNRPKDRVRCIIGDGLGNIYVSGDFTNSQGKYYVAKWNGSKWSELGGFNSLKANGYIHALCKDKLGNIYAAGSFTNSFNKTYVAKWNGSTWSQVGGTINSSLSLSYEPILTLCIDSAGALYAAGAFGFLSNTNKYVAKYTDANGWDGLGTFPYDGDINSLFSDAAGNIYAAGDFINSSYHKYVGKHNGTAWSEIGGFNALAANGSIYAICRDQFNTIYAVGSFTNANNNYYVAKFAQSLPLKLLSFTAQTQQNNILLDWQTANEVNVSHINIQRSVNGKEFSTIGKVNVGKNEYRFTDDRLPLIVDGKLYYKLEIVDRDGSKSYSEIKSVERRPFTVNSISVYPNPSNGNITIECANAKELSIIDYLGRTVHQSTVNSQPTTVNTKQFTKGIYIVKAVMNNGEIKTEKLVVE